MQVSFGKKITDFRLIIEVVDCGALGRNDLRSKPNARIGYKMNKKYAILLIAIYTFVVAFAIIHWLSYRSNGYVLIVYTTTIIQSIIGWLIFFGFRYRSEKAHERENQ